MLFYLNNDDKAEIKSLKAGSFPAIGWKEKDLENLIANNLSQLIPESQLMVLFQEKPYREAADIYALDEKGDLYIFELKRWRGHQENLLQVLRYGQVYGQYSYEQLQDMLRIYEKMPTLDLAAKHYEYFKDTPKASIKTKLEPPDFNKDQHFIVITNGIDADTRNAIKYWQDKGLKIDSIIYRVYSIGEKHILEFNPYNPEGEVIIEEEEGCFIVNTNLTWSEEDYRDMLQQQKAAAYGGRRFSIRNIEKGDTVFLYQNGVGVIAYGKAIDNYRSTYNSKKKLEEFYIPMRFDWQVDPDTEREKAVHAWEINRKLDSQYSFRQTVFIIPQKMAEVIKELANRKK
jgi:hypothetical protein